MPLTVCFQLVGHALNTLQQLTFQDTIEFYSRKRDWSSNFIVNLYSTLYLKGVCALLYFLQHKDNQRPQFIKVKTNSVNETYDMKVKILAMFFLLPLFCSAQITMDDDCFDRSNRIFAKVILEVFDTSFVHKMVDSGQRFLLALNVDTAGYVLGVRNGRGNFPETQVKEMTDKLREYFQTNMVQFPLCYVLQDIGLSSEDQLKLARKIFSEKKERLFGANFPGGLFFPYEADKRKGFEGSKFDYLLLRISQQKIPIKKKISKDATKGD